MNTVRTKMEKAGKMAGLILLATLVFITVLEAVTAITVTGSWSLSIGQANLTGGAGTDLTSTYTSATNQATLGVSGTYSHTWRIDVMRIDTTWHTNLHLWVKRTNNGTSGSGSYSGGTTFLDLTTTNQTFMTGAGDRTGFTLQFQLTGVSTAIPAASYSTTIRYTITQTN
jgi:hypothetical protein